MTRSPVADGENFSAVYWSALVNAHGGEAIISGCTPTKGTGNWDVDVAAGTAFITGTGEVSVSAQTESLTAPGSDADLDAGEARVDLVTVDSTGTTNTTEGTAASGNKQPVAPDIPSGQALIAAAFVDGDAASLSGSDVHDYRILLNDDKERYQDGGSHELDAADLAGGDGTTGQVLETDGSAATWSDKSPTVTDPSDVTASRSLGTWFQNTTGDPLIVIAEISDGQPKVHVNTSQTDNPLYDASSHTAYAFVPDQSYYKIVEATQAIDNWFEQQIGWN